MINLTRDNKKYICKLDMAFEPVRGKWKPLIISNLASGRKRFTTLLNLNSGISHKVLNEKLKELQEDNLISKKFFYEYPPKVEYSLTSKGYQYAKLLKQFENIG